MRDVLIGVEIVGKRELAELRHGRGHDFGRGLFAGEKLAADFSKLQVRLTRDHVIRQCDDGLLLGLVADLGSAENDREVRAHALDGSDDFGGFGDVPDVNAEPQNLRLPREQCLGDVEWTLVDVELRDGRARFQLAEIGHEVAQAKGGVNVLRVERR